jgi:hypothetical protein
LIALLFSHELHELPLKIRANSCNSWQQLVNAFDNVYFEICNERVKTPS